MNLAFVIQRFGDLSGGTEKYAFELLKYLSTRGHQLHVYCAKAGFVSPPENVVVHDLGLPRWRRRRGLGFALAARAVPAMGHDLVQSFARTLGHDVFRAGGGLHAAWLAARSDCLLERVATGLSPGARVDTWLDGEAIRRARIVVCNSHMAADQVVRWSGKPASRVRVIRNGVDGARFRPDPEARQQARKVWNIPDGGRVALFLGSGFHRKGLSVASAAFAKVARPSDRLVVIGRDSHSAASRRTLERELGSKLIFLGHVRDPERWLPGADATLLPTRYDSAANATLEAMACGVPPITTARDGNSELVPDPALVVEDPKDVQAFSVALEGAWGRAGDLSQALRSVALDWPVSRNGEAMESLYRELVNG